MTNKSKAPRAPRVHVQVDTDAIEDATRGDSGHCMIAESLKKAVPDAPPPARRPPEASSPPSATRRRPHGRASGWDARCWGCTWAVKDGVYQVKHLSAMCTVPEHRAVSG